MNLRTACGGAVGPERSYRGRVASAISQDLDELMEVSTLLSIIADGRLSFPVPTRDVTVEQIGVMMGGHGEAAHA